MDKNKVIFIVGPTASGKSDMALSLAKTFDGEIVSCDSMQIYKGLNIGTAKESEEKTKEVARRDVAIIALPERVVLTPPRRAADKSRPIQSAIKFFLNLWLYFVIGVT